MAIDPDAYSAVDLKAATPDSSVPSGALIFGADSQSAAAPSVYPLATLAASLPFTQAGTGAVERTAQDKLRDAVSVKDFGAVGDGIVDDTAAIQAAVNAAQRVLVPGGMKMLISSDITMPRYSALVGESKSSERSDTGASSIVSTNGSGIVLDSQCELANLVIDGGAKPAASVGVMIGAAGAFKAESKVRNVSVVGFETGINFDNSYLCELADVFIGECEVGIRIDATAGTALGYQTTLRFDRVHVTNCDEEGILQEASSGQVFQMSWADVTVEGCGDASHPQVKLGPNLAFSWRGGYVESVAVTKPTAIIAANGRFEGIRINGADIAFDFGASSSNAEIDNCSLAEITSYSIVASGAVNGTICVERTVLPAALNVVVDRLSLVKCTGAGVPTAAGNGATALLGTKPRFAVGAAGAQCREIYAKEYPITTTVGAGATVRSSTMVVSCVNGAAYAVPKTDLPDGLVFYLQRHAVNDDRYQLVFVNLTGGSINVNHTFVVVATRFAAFSA